jgi:hypothetical protein
MRFIFFHAELEDGLTICVLQNRATYYKKSQLDIEKLKRICPGRLSTLFQTPPFQDRRTGAVRVS